MFTVIHKKVLIPSCRICHRISLTKRFFSGDFENKYTENEREKILQIINNNDSESLTRYDIAKIRIKKLSQWFNKHGKLNNISELETVDGFTENTIKKFYKSILEGPKDIHNKIKGQILYPSLSEKVRQNCRLVLAIHVSFNSISWTLVNRANYELIDWNYRGMDFPEGKKVHITEILEIACQITAQLPDADVYVMKAEATSLRGAGSDPNNPKVLTVNLQKAQLIAMLIALINTKHNGMNVINDGKGESKPSQRVYFLRSTLPYRLYRVLVGNENVSTEQAINDILLKARELCPNHSHVHIGRNLVARFHSQKELQKDILGHSLLLALTFMDICIYINSDSIAKLSRN